MCDGCDPTARPSVPNPVPQPGLRGYCHLEAGNYHASSPVWLVVQKPCLGTVKIKKTWSDQLPGRQCNSVNKDGGAWRAFLLVGTRSDDKLYVKAEVELTPDMPEFRSQVIVALGSMKNGRSTVAAYGTLEGNIASIRVDAVDTTLDYRVMAGCDLNGNGRLDPLEVTTVSRRWIKAVDRFDYRSGVEFLCDGGLIAIPALPIAAKLLRAFANGSTPWWATVDSTSVAYNDPDLEHTVGLDFDVNCVAQTDEYVFSPTSYVASKVADSYTMANVLRARMNQDYQALKNAFQQNPDMTTTQLVWSISDTIRYETYEYLDLDLYWAFGKAHLDLTNVVVTVNRNTYGFLARIQGTQTDLYDWDYGLDPLCAKVQAGYPTLGEGGKVRRNRVLLDNLVSVSTGFAF